MDSLCHPPAAPIGVRAASVAWAAAPTLKAPDTARSSRTRDARATALQLFFDIETALLSESHIGSCLGQTTTDGSCWQRVCLQQSITPFCDFVIEVVTRVAGYWNGYDTWCKLPASWG
ncbi:MAG: hypothetical protein BWY85_01546 [Firmicutes bacterium ADurb.Bin506]|nr:MAG: hypothetical protein BWY85_01546 [Firmicutes bacterium ADurb.Bin506]